MRRPYLTCPGMMAGAPSTRPMLASSILVTFHLRKKAPDSKSRRSPLPMAFKVACEDVFFPGAMQPCDRSTANALPATLSSRGKGAGAFFSQNPVPDLSLAACLKVYTRQTLFFTRKPRKPCESRAKAPYFLHESRESRSFFF